MKDDFEPLENIEHRWNAASSPWNPTALSEIYDKDAVFFGGRPANYVSREKIKDYFASYNEMFKAASLKLVEQSAVQVSEHAIIYQGYGDFAFHLHDGRVTYNTLRTSLVLCRKATSSGEWQIFMHHFSPSPETPPVPQ
ncbi:YybH family protein [Pseudochelatococcus sp. B33]